MDRLSPQRVLVTGASRGIGAEIGRIASREGHHVILTARNAGDLDALASALPGPTTVLPADLADAGARAQLWEDAGQVDILVNNAGLGGSGDFARPDTWTREQEMIEVNLVAATDLAKRATAQMIARGSGRILNVASLAGFLPGPNMAIYFATKAYLRSLSEALWQETKGRGITVTALCPGPVDTNFFRAGNLRGGRQMMSADTCARAGWDGMMAGRRTVIPGWRFKALALASRLPRSLLLPITARTLNHAPFARDD
ncbi:SDR family NAD(P)-dependent oxidoreductase [Palleronia caenipelagi]|uniref:SDR family oxidoreductase n=1 Tax=Palleronia caenipelagi TaxID=2489174 RepID=A0A547Q065_9RHOB|nr:SDR family oxidoreductase [Palleronia caenipelagi]TRD19774.1 SDR family oxidoreductase [Palleronia caenipelagi]